jgi:CheY-like chemotaxis protein
MRRCLHAFIKNQIETCLLDELLASLRSLTEQSVRANLSAVSTLSFALNALIEDLLKIPGQINPSSLRTVSQSIDFLVTLLDPQNLSRTKDPTLANIFAVDDDPDARKTIRGAIETVNLKVVCAENAKTTLAVVGDQKFDLVFIDVRLPDMNGFELCTRLRKLPEYNKTPVVFITGAVTVQNRVQSSLSGGNDFIAKPFNLYELGVKALIWIFKGQLGIV